MKYVFLIMLISFTAKAEGPGSYTIQYDDGSSSTTYINPGNSFNTTDSNGTYNSFINRDTITTYGQDGSYNTMTISPSYPGSNYPRYRPGR